MSRSSVPFSAERAPVEATAGQAEFRELFRAHCPYVARIAHAVLGTSDEVDDLLQDVFLLAHRHLHRLREPGALRGWLATITVREARRKLRRRKMRAVLGLDRDVAVEPEPPGEQIGAERRMELRALERALDRLPVAQRMAWTLRLEGHTAPEIARLCECSLATAKRRIAAAQSRLKREFDHG